MRNNKEDENINAFNIIENSNIIKVFKSFSKSKKTQNDGFINEYLFLK